MILCHVQGTRPWGQDGILPAELSACGKTNPQTVNPNTRRHACMG